MSLAVGTNSWATVAEGDTYLTDRIDAEEWFALSDSSATSGERTKATLLVSAYFWLSGSPQLSIPSSSSTANVKNAQIEAAWFLHEYYEELKDRRAALSTGMSILRISRRTEHLSMKNLSIPDHILGMLQEYQITNTTALLKGQYDV